MSSGAKSGHAAQDVTAEAQDGRESRGRFLRAAVEHAELQLSAVEDQPDRLTVKFDELDAQWRAKIDEAIQIREAAIDERDRWRDELDAFEGN